MAITKGGWNSPAGASFLGAVGTTIADMDALLDQHVAAIMATDAGWSVASGPTTYASSAGVWVRLSHTSGPSVILVGLLNSSFSSVVIDAGLMWDGAVRNPSTSTYRGAIYVTWLPSGAPNPGDEPNDATFLATSQFRFVPLTPIISNYTTATSRVLWAGQSDGSLWCWHQTNPADSTSIQAWWCGAPDLYVALRQSGDVSGAGHGALTRAAAGSLTNADSSYIGQCFKSDGSTRAGALTNWGAATAFVGSMCQSGTSYSSPEISVGRVNADVATTGIVANNGYKGAINPYALVAVPVGAGTKAVNGDGNYVWATGGFGMGWSPTNGSPA